MRAIFGVPERKLLKDFTLKCESVLKPERQRRFSKEPDRTEQ